MRELIDKLKQYPFFQKMDFELEPLLLADYKCDKVFRLKDLTNNVRYKLRVNTANFPDAVKKETRVLRFLEQFSSYEQFTKIVYADGAEEVLVTDYFDGIPLNDKSAVFNDNKAEILEKVEEQLRALHQMRCPVQNIVTGEKFANWYEALKPVFDNYISLLADNNVIGRREIDLTYRFIEKHKNYLENVESSVIHGDLKPANIVWNPEDNKVHLIDFETVRIGDALFDYYRLYNDGWGFRSELEQNGVYVLYLLNTYLRWLTYAFLKRHVVEPRAVDGLERSLKLALKLL